HLPSIDELFRQITRTRALPRPLSCIVRSIVNAPAAILIADDDETSSRFLKRLLTREGHSVSVVQSADAVLSACATHPPDLVLIDLVAPQGHGFEICRQ